MGSLWKYVTGQTGRKIRKTKQDVSDVRSLKKFKRQGYVQPNEKAAVKRAATRLNDDMSAFKVNVR